MKRDFMKNTNPDLQENDPVIPEVRTTESAESSAKNTLKTLFSKKGAKPILAVVVAGAVTVSVFGIRTGNNSVSASTTVVESAVAETGDISTTVSTTGTLETDDSVDVTVPVGIKVKKVLVSRGDEVEEGDQLATVYKATVASALLEVRADIETVKDAIDDLGTVTDTDSDEYLQKEYYKYELKELKKIKKQLNEMYETGAITADSAGTICSINIEDYTEVGSSSDSSSSSTTSTDTSALTTTSTSASTLTATTLTASDSTESTGSVSTLTAASLTASSLTAMATSSSDSSSVVAITEDLLSSLSITIPGAGETPQTEIESTDAYTGTITWDCSSTFEAGKTYTATVTLTAADGYAFSTADDYAISFSGGVLSDDSPSIKGGANTEGNKMVIKVSFQVASSSTTSDVTTGSTTDSSESSTTGSLSDDATSSADTSVSGSVSSGSTSGSTSSSTDSTSTITIDSVETVSAITMSSDDTMLVSVSVDESDINSIEEGQSVAVTLDALEGQIFEGTIDNINTTATGSGGGSVKYEVTVSLPKEDGMLDGMTASAVITVSSTEDAVLVPSAAIVEIDGATYVYTENNDGELSGEVQVTTGLSDGTNVAITDGLESGTTVYYTVEQADEDDLSTDSSADTETDSSDLESLFGGEGGSSDSMPSGNGGGSMPSGGGSMPSGGGGGAQ